MVAAIVGQSSPNQMKWLSARLSISWACGIAAARVSACAKRDGAVVARGDHEGGLTDRSTDVRGGAGR